MAEHCVQRVLGAKERIRLRNRVMRAACPKGVACERPNVLDLRPEDVPVTCPGVSAVSHRGRRHLPVGRSQDQSASYAAHYQRNHRALQRDRKSSYRYAKAHGMVDAAVDFYAARGWPRGDVQLHHPGEGGARPHLNRDPKTWIFAPRCVHMAVLHGRACRHSHPKTGYRKFRPRRQPSRRRSSVKRKARTKTPQRTVVK